MGNEAPICEKRCSVSQDSPPPPPKKKTKFVAFCLSLGKWLMSKNQCLICPGFWTNFGIFNAKSISPKPFWNRRTWKRASAEWSRWAIRRFQEELPYFIFHEPEKSPVDSAFFFDCALGPKEFSGEIFSRNVLKRILSEHPCAIKHSFLQAPYFQRT